MEDRQLLSVAPNLAWATYLGGSGADSGLHVAVDTAGNVFATGPTTSTSIGGVQNPAPSGTSDAFVAKFTPTGSPLWVTYLSGTGNVMPYGIAVDSAGNALVAGVTNSPDLAGTAPNSYHGGTNDAFVAKVNGDGTLAWATYLGGSAWDDATGVAVDSAGNVLVSGFTQSTDFVGANNVYHGGSEDAFVVKVWNNTGTNLDGNVAWATYLGGSGFDSASDVAVDGAGNALVTGFTRSTDFAAANNAYHGGLDAFVAKVTGTGSLAWSTYRGGSGDDYGAGIAVDGAGNALVTGYTLSSDFAGAKGSLQGASDAFVAKVNGNDGSLAWATYLGGSGGDSAHSIALDASGNALVTGGTSSADFPGAYNQYVGGSNGAGAGPSDAFVAKVTGNGALAWASYLGGSGWDSGEGIAIDASGNALVAGPTNSTDFGGANNSYNGGTFDAFLEEFTPPAWAFSSYKVTPQAKINDANTVTANLVVSGSYPIVDVNVSVTITHPSDADLSLTLVAPDGTKVPLVLKGTLSGANLTGTVFDDEALSPITAGAAPYTGNYRPASPLSALDGKMTSGTWKLQVTDNVRNRLTGTLNSWGLALLYDTAPAAAPNAAAGSSASLTDAAMASYILYQQPPQPDTSKDKKSSAIPAVHLALLDLGV